MHGFKTRRMIKHRKNVVREEGLWEAQSKAWMPPRREVLVKSQKLRFLQE